MSENAYELAMKEALASCPVDDSIIDTVQASHDTIGSIYYADYDIDVTLTLEDESEQEFKKGSFSIGFPERSDKGASDIPISFGMDKTVMEYFEDCFNAGGQITLTRRLYLSSDTSGPQNTSSINYIVSEISTTELEVSIKADFAIDVVNKRFPTRNFTTSNHPSL